jgi:hypothetical protein
MSTIRRPDPPDQATKNRWLHTSTRYLLLCGEWEQELHDWMAMHIEGSRLAAWGLPDMSANPLKQGCKEMAVTYHQPPRVSHTDVFAAKPLLGDEGILSKTGHFLKMRRGQMMTIGMRELLVRPYRAPDGTIATRTVYPHNVAAWADPAQPDKPTILWELRQRIINGKAVYAWDQFDLSDPAQPVFRVVVPKFAKNDSGNLVDVDVTGLIFRDEAGNPVDFEGENYWWRDRDDTPVIPYAWYHAEIGEGLFDAYANREVVRGTLTTAMLYTMAIRGARDASGNSVLGVNADFAALSIRSGSSGSPGTTAANVTGEHAAAVIPLEPGAMHEINPKDPDKPVDIHIIPPGSDVAVLDAFAHNYEMRVIHRLGMKPADPTAQHGDPRSGYALALDNNQKRVLAQQLEPVYLAGDREVLRLIAIVYNRGTAAGQKHPIPETGYSIEYPAIPLSPEEERERRERLTWEMTLGIKEPWQVVREYLPGLTEAEARRRAGRINIEDLIALTTSNAGAAGRAI